MIMIFGSVCALLGAFLICVLIGKRFIPWLKKKDAIQPIKDEVATIYEDQNGDPVGKC